MESLQEVIDESLQKYILHISRVVGKLDQSGLTDEEKGHFLEKCQDVIGECCTLDLDHKRNLELLKEAENVFADESNTKTPDEIFEELKKQKKNKKKDEAFNDHEIYKSVIEIVKEAREKAGLDEEEMDQTEAGEDGLLVSEFQVSTVCPISRKKMTDPYKSKACKHTFDKESILALLKNKTNIRCPIGGCGHLVGKEDLVIDYQMRRHIDRLDSQ
ncbi:E3 SUMO-protein ligase NSE2-like [Neocloeon triangulifer]|uniref:E3 SUMO-protein ligase NSE2-like n=1 Tax=Neocloeon triangulifer TaxID=2078957 RepID=UPI00286ED63F|nr:E3 SUMO-protein ligase NSE2-like [Neocloeon triangulifer]